MDDDVASIIRQTLIAGKLQEKRDREAEAVAEQMERQMFKDLVGAEIDEWGKKNQGNIRTMLAHLGDVLWAGAYTRPLVSSNRAVSGTKYTIGTPTMTPDTC